MNNDEMTFERVKEVTLKVVGNFHLEGWQNNHIGIRSSDKLNKISQAPNGIFIKSVGDLELFVPYDVEVNLEKVLGDVYVSDFEGNLIVNKVQGEIFITQAKSVVIRKAIGDCQINVIDESLWIDKLSGDLVALDIRGMAQIHSVSGDVELVAAALGGTIRVGGDIRVGFISETLNDLSINSGGDLLLALNPGTQGVLNLNSVSDSVRKNLEKSDVTDIDAKSYRLGEGGGTITAKAAGDIKVIDYDQSLFAEKYKYVNKVSQRWKSWSEKFIGRATRKLDEIDFQAI
jgi:DUF4097 and DUF4098 domain-containing protein YvlB